MSRPTGLQRASNFGLDFLGAENLGASFEVAVTPTRISAKADGIPTWLAALLAVGSAFGIGYLASRCRR